jgi:hypothetical protein
MAVPWHHSDWGQVEIHVDGDKVTAKIDMTKSEKVQAHIEVDPDHDQLTGAEPQPQVPASDSTRHKEKKVKKNKKTKKNKKNQKAPSPSPPRKLLRLRLMTRSRSAADKEPLRICSSADKEPLIRSASDADKEPLSRSASAADKEPLSISRSAAQTLRTVNTRKIGRPTLTEICRECKKKYCRCFPINWNYTLVFPIKHNEQR